MCNKEGGGQERRKKKEEWKKVDKVGLRVAGEMMDRKMTEGGNERKERRKRRKNGTKQIGN